MQPLVFGQPEETLARIRAAYDRNILRYLDDDGGVSNADLGEGRRGIPGAVRDVICGSYGRNHPFPVPDR